MLGRTRCPVGAGISCAARARARRSWRRYVDGRRRCRWQSVIGCGMATAWSCSRRFEEIEAVPSPTCCAERGRLTQRSSAASESRGRTNRDEADALSGVVVETSTRSAAGWECRKKLREDARAKRHQAGRRIRQVERASAPRRRREAAACSSATRSESGQCAAALICRRARRRRRQAPDQSRAWHHDGPCAGGGGAAVRRPRGQNGRGTPAFSGLG